MRFHLFERAQKKGSYDREHKVHVLRCSICTGEQVACFRDIATGELQEVMLIRGEEDLREFRREYGVDGEIERVY